MPRPQRIEYPDAYYHVMNRGRGRQIIFHNANEPGQALHKENSNSTMFKKKTGQALHKENSNSTMLKDAELRQYIDSAIKFKKIKLFSQ